MLEGAATERHVDLTVARDVQVNRLDDLLRFVRALRGRLSP